MLRKMLVSMVLVLGAAALCFAGDFNGKWETNVKTPDGQEMALVFDFKVDGEALSGSVSSPFGELPLENGKISGDEISFDVDVQGSKIEHHGKLAGEAIEMKSHSQWGDTEMTLKHQESK